MQQHNDSGREPTTTSSRENKGGLAQTATDALSKTVELGQQAANTAGQAAAETASTVTTQVKDLLDRQVASGVNMVGRVASSAKRAAEDLEQDAPQIAGLVRGMADRMEGFADDLRDQSGEQLLRAASDLTRRQPALVFGLAALAGFFAFRTFKNTPSSIALPSIRPAPSPSIQPAQEGFRAPADHVHGL